jgi:hypothetical protein
MDLRACRRFCAEKHFRWTPDPPTAVFSSHGPHPPARAPVCLAGGAAALPQLRRRGLWRDWFHLRGACPTCRLNLERGEDGYIVGAQTFNIITAELLFAATFVGVLVATPPDVPWTWLQYGGPAPMIIFPVFS